MVEASDFECGGGAQGYSEPLEELLAAASRAFLRKEVEIIVNLDYSAIIHEVLRSVCPGITEQW